uniref:Uncharacterized protein n=1 Tax=Rhizophora mucronata TaxID=61149 RepID=A0A2P2QLN0_RHIMU
MNWRGTKVRETAILAFKGSSTFQSYAFEKSHVSQSSLLTSYFTHIILLWFCTCHFLPILRYLVL